MPISSGAGGKAARMHLANSSSGGVGATKSRNYWSNAAAHTTATKSHSTSALPQSVSVVSSRPSGGGSTSSSVTNLNPQRSASPSSSARTATVINHQTAGMSGKQQHRQHQKTATVEKYKQIRHISPPSSHATTSPTAFKYFTGSERDNIENQSRPESPESSFAGLARENKGKEPVPQASGASQVILVSKQHERVKKTKGKRNMTMSSLGGRLTVTGGLHQQQHQHERPIRGELHAHPQLVTTTQQTKQSSGGGLFSSLMMLGGGQRAATSEQRRQSHHYPKATTINQQQQQQRHNSQSSINPSLSFVSGNQTSSSASSSSAANLHSLASLNGGMAARSTQGLTTSTTTTTTITKRINLKYVKTLIILLMSLDLAVTLVVHHFASHDEFSLIFTHHKLRFSLVNLVLSAIWFLVLTAAILFDIYAILLIGALVDIASFILLLVCSAIHFTHRIDYNTVNLTSLLLLLFSIIVLHVYLIVIAALTIYLMTAIKRRRKH